MVARPAVMIVVERMRVEDLPAVHVIERESFSTPWPAHAYQHELEQNRLAHYIVARWGGEIVGFAGMWREFYSPAGTIRKSCPFILIIRFQDWFFFGDYKSHPCVCIEICIGNMMR